MKARKVTYKFLPRRIGRRIDMGEDLSGIDLRDAMIERADFRGAIMKRANLCRAALRGAKFNGADLREAHFWKADLTGCDFSGADLRGADMDYARLDGARFHGAKIERTDLPVEEYSAESIRRSVSDKKAKPRRKAKVKKSAAGR